MKSIIVLSCVLFLCSCSKSNNQEEPFTIDDGSQGLYVLDFTESKLSDQDYLTNPPLEYQFYLTQCQLSPIYT